jgi:hypothetical protein
MGGGTEETGDSEGLLEGAGTESGNALLVEGVAVVALMDGEFVRKYVGGALGEAEGCAEVGAMLEGATTGESDGLDDDANVGLLVGSDVEPLLEGTGAMDGESVLTSSQGRKREGNEAGEGSASSGSANSSIEDGMIDG